MVGILHAVLRKSFKTDFYSLSGKAGLQSPAWNLRSVLQKCLVATGICSCLVLEQQSVTEWHLPLPTASTFCFPLPLLPNPTFPWTSFPYVSSFKQVIREAALAAQTQHKLPMPSGIFSSSSEDGSELPQHSITSVTMLLKKALSISVPGSKWNYKPDLPANLSAKTIIALI